MRYSSERNIGHRQSRCWFLTGPVLVVPVECYGIRHHYHPAGRAPASPPRASQHLHIIGNNLGRITILAVLILPFTGLQFAFNINLAEPFFRYSPMISARRLKRYDPVPFCLFQLSFTSLFVIPTV